MTQETEAKYTSLPELFVTDPAVQEMMDEINELKKEMYAAQQEAMEKAAEPFKEKLNELEMEVQLTYRMVL